MNGCYGHEGRFPPPKLNGRYRFRKRSLAVSDCRPGLLRQALRRLTAKPSASTLPVRYAGAASESTGLVTVMIGEPRGAKGKTRLMLLRRRLAIAPPLRL